jgi:putative methionine-R-sulfoxide reductase with GAF domain
MIDVLKDRYKLGLLMATLFFLGIIISAYTIYSLPGELMLSEGYESAFAPVYSSLAITFFLGGLTVWLALQYKTEIVVFRDKQTEKVRINDSADETKTTISLESVKTTLKDAKTIDDVAHLGLQVICKQLNAGQGAFYFATSNSEKRVLELKTGYALSIGESKIISYEFGEGLIGQAASGVKTLYVDEIPEGYIKILSGLGSASPRYLLIVPVKKQQHVIGVIEIASFTAITDDQRKFVEESAQLIAETTK